MNLDQFREFSWRPCLRRKLHHSFHIFCGNIEIGVNILNIVVIFQAVHEFQHALGLLAFQLHHGLRESW